MHFNVPIVPEKISPLPQPHPTWYLYTPPSKTLDDTLTLLYIYLIDLLMIFPLWRRIFYISTLLVFTQWNYIDIPGWDPGLDPGHRGSARPLHLPQDCINFIQLSKKIILFPWIFYCLTSLKITGLIYKHWKIKKSFQKIVNRLNIY